MYLAKENVTFADARFAIASAGVFLFCFLFPPVRFSFCFCTASERALQKPCTVKAVQVITSLLLVKLEETGFLFHCLFLPFVVLCMSNLL